MPLDVRNDIIYVRNLNKERVLKKSKLKYQTQGRTWQIAMVLTLVLCAGLFGWGFGDVVINELMWMGTSHHQTDEFLEIRNMTGTPVDFSSTRWSIYRQGEFMLTIDEGILPAFGYFLICRRDSTSSLIRDADIISSFLVLTNSNTSYALYAGPSDASPLLDVADDGIGVPLSGRFVFSEGVYWSMERSEPPGDGAYAENWHVGCLSRGFVEGAVERGTPGHPNYRNVPPNPIDSILISPGFIADDTIVTAYAFGIHDPDSVPGQEIVIFDWLIDDSLVWSDWDSSAPYLSILDSTRTFPGSYLRARAYVFDGTDSSVAAFSEPCAVHFEKWDLIINEIAWMGSNRSPDDEWIELLNNSNRQMDFSRNPFILNVTGSTSFEILIDDGVLARGDLFLVSKMIPSSISSALDVAPNLVESSLAFDDTGFEIEVSDFAEYLVDDVYASSGPFAGENIETDSVKYTMSRKTPPGTGSNPANWFTSEVSSGFKSGSMERGTPGGANTLNNPPILDFVGDAGYIDDMFHPNIGNMDSFFWWRVKYIDADNEPPDSIWMMFDVNGDGNWQPEEFYPLFREDFADSNYADGVVYRRWMYGLKPTETGDLFSIRVSDGKTFSGYGIPAENGPVVEETFRFTIFGRSWTPDTVWGPPYDLPYVLTKTDEMPFLIHSGDTPLEVGLAITQADIFDHSSDTFSFSPGGWNFVDDLDSSGINLYSLSAIFVPTLEAPSAADFNDVSEDLLIGEFKWFDGDTLGRPSDSLDAIIWPKDRLRFAFRLDLPEQTAGFYSEWRHRITVTLRIRPSLP